MSTATITSGAWPIEEVPRIVRKVVDKVVNFVVNVLLVVVVLPCCLDIDSGNLAGRDPIMIMVFGARQDKAGEPSHRVIQIGLLRCRDSYLHCTCH